VCFNQSGKEFELTLDIQGSIDYSPDTLDCRCKGELIPWALYDLETGDETDLSSLSIEDVERIWPDKKIADIINNGRNYEIGIYPVDDSDEVFELAEEDVLTNCEGCFEMYIDKDNHYNVEFKFDTELNIY
jgi:hypothetical protein